MSEIEWKTDALTRAIGAELHAIDPKSSALMAVYRCSDGCSTFVWELKVSRGLRANTIEEAKAAAEDALNALFSRSVE